MPAFILDTSRHGAQRVFRRALSKLRQNRALSDFFDLLSCNNKIDISYDRSCWQEASSKCAPMHF